jgi:hypothetical protein
LALELVPAYWCRLFVFIFNFSDTKEVRIFKCKVMLEGLMSVMFPSYVTSASAIEKGKWLEWRDAPERTDSSGSNGPVEPDLDLDEEESFIVGRLVSADVIEHETDHAPDYGNYGVISGRLALS